jgi:hypothetical protein
MAANALQVEDDTLEHACHILFGRHIAVSQDFLEQSLKENGVKKAYRKMALITHPDHMAGPTATGGVSFLEVRDAYERLLLFLRGEARVVPPPQPTRQKPPQRRSGRRKNRQHREPREDNTFQYRWLPERHLRLGEFLYLSGIIPLRVLVESITWQQQSRPRFGEIAIQKGMLSREQLRELVLGRTYPEKLGEAGARLGLLSRADVGSIVDYQRLIQRKIGKFYLDRGLLDAYHLFYHLNRLGKHNQRYPSSG